MTPFLFPTHVSALLALPTRRRFDTAFDPILDLQLSPPSPMSLCYLAEALTVKSEASASASAPDPYPLPHAAALSAAS